MVWYGFYLKNYQRKKKIKNLSIYTFIGFQPCDCIGETILADTDLVVPYSKILTYGIMLIIPLSIGIAITRWLPRLSALLVKSVILHPELFCYASGFQFDSGKI
jgi:hypothetical protein